MEQLPNLATSGGIAVIVLVLLGVLKSAVPSFDGARFGALVAIGSGILLSFANVAFGGVVDGTGAAPITTFLIGLLGGASASGIYSAAKGTSQAMA